MTLEMLGWTGALADALAALAIPSLRPARVGREDRESYIVYTGDRAVRARVAGALRHRAAGRSDYPAVGDWVAVAGTRRGPAACSTPELAVIHAMLPRRSVVLRHAAGGSGGEQLVAANVDTLLICCGLDHNFNLRRIERYLTVAYSGGASPVILLTKSDLCAAVVERHADVEAVAGGAPVLALSILDRRGLEPVRALLRPGSTAALVGSSGVGKSSLINALLARDALAVAPVRAADSRGRHTTTQRQMLLVPGGGLIIDTPGMREVGLVADEQDVGASFDEIEALAADCRFRDCTHTREPGCAVLAAVARGELDPARVESRRKQLRELQYLERRDDPLAAAAERKRWKAIHKAGQRWTKEKYGL